MVTLTDRQQAIAGLVMFGALLLAFVIHLIYRLYTVRRYDRQLSQAGVPPAHFDLMGGRIWLYMRAAFTPNWFDRHQRRQYLFDPALLAPVITRLDKLLMVTQLVPCVLFFGLLLFFKLGT
ncbi:hypothetical protein [Salinicola avicenniae]|uniref:hypothetical protein n=1 Tax=Salinicola avicenniae TaxID=2916836 RepID=UPI0020733F6A|nr:MULTISPECIES: hypothetical protein [unclassified Salinicola]